MIRVLDMTKLFTKELFIYSLFDFQFKQPVRIKFLAYLLLSFFVWTLPTFLLFWPPNPYILILGALVPFGMASLLSRPIWGGKPFSQWFTCQMKYIFNPKTYLDGKHTKELGTYKIDNKIVVSRRQDYKKLIKLLRKEN